MLASLNAVASANRPSCGASAKLKIFLPQHGGVPVASPLTVGHVPSSVGSL